MSITERTLRKWRKEALESVESLKGYESTSEFVSQRREISERILKLTQELLDQKLLGR